MGFVPTVMHDVRFAIVIRAASRMSTRCHTERDGRTEH